MVPDAQPDLGADFHLIRKADEHVKRVRDPAVGRILQRHHAEIRVPAAYFLEYRRDVGRAVVNGRFTEPLDRGEVTVTVFRSQVRDLLVLLDRTRAADEFAKDGLDRVGIERTTIRREDVREYFFFARRGEHVAALLHLDLPDLRGDRGPLIE